MVKANIGGSGAGIVKFADRDALAAAAKANQLDFGVDHTHRCRNSFRPAAGTSPVSKRWAESISTRSKFTQPANRSTSARRIFVKRADGVELVRSACPVNALKTGLKVEGYTPPAEVISACEKIMQTAGIDVGGIEYMIDDRDGKIVYYDINALSNFVADAVNVVGFDPFVKLVDYLVKRELLASVGCNPPDWFRTCKTSWGSRPALAQNLRKPCPYGYWMPVFGGWLRNVDDENMFPDMGIQQTPRSEANR